MKRKKCWKKKIFSFRFATFTDIEQQLKHLHPKKASQDTDIWTRILKENSHHFAQFVLKNYNEVINQPFMIY